jgi:hypothetical protein
MSYGRVIPRDLFNESSLLKCYGALWIELDNGRFPGAALEYEEDGAPFAVVQNQSSGGITLANVRLTVRGETVHLERPLNARRAYPLYAYPSDSESESELSVFTDDGRLTGEMRAFLMGESDA